MAEHTPGPWRWNHYPDGRKLLAGPDRAVIHCPDAPMTCDPADARLIAAAPELLEALLTALPYVEDAEGDEGYKAGVVRRQAEQIRRLLDRVLDRD